MIWRARQFEFRFPRPVLIMGILNVTPDSFSDGGKYAEADRAFARALELDSKFAGLGLGLVDGMVAAVAERRRVYRVLTSDRRGFSAIRVGTSLTRALVLLP